MKFNSRDEAEKYVKQFVNHSCKKCYGRGYVGYLANSNTIVICGCVQKHRQFIQDHEKIKIKED